MSAASQPNGRTTDVEKARGIHPRAADLVDGLVSLFGVDGAREFIFSALRYWKLEYGEEDKE